ncbi:MAG: methyltransferase domain-containing protein [Solirubrobacterales bacterium]|nr:methyltransferase domain-containing protein [Solirubrobacterales bacterium]
MRQLPRRPCDRSGAARRRRSPLEPRGAERVDAVGGEGAELLSRGASPPLEPSARAAAYDAWYETPLGRAVDAAECEALIALAAPRAGERALDAGCGTGIYTRRLAERGLEVTGVDVDAEMLAAARLKAPAARLVEADVTSLPFEDRSFDLSLAVTVLCFVSDPEQTVSELVRVTRPDGRVVVGELNRWSAWAAWRRVKGWRGSGRWRSAHFYSPRQLGMLLARGGAAKIVTGAAAYLPPGSPGWLIARASALEGRARHLGAFGAALSLARGIRGP